MDCQKRVSFITPMASQLTLSPIFVMLLISEITELEPFRMNNTLNIYIIDSCLGIKHILTIKKSL